mmetsp:Transcript_18463/g.39936  ORF Transcript_18463/g.39936 Transcript_18463/m.39936 type:complete len:442 (+) Transcript_18463:65-1390(+)
MGRILDVLRRKRSQPSTSPRSGELFQGFSSPVHSNQSRDEENDKENEKPRAIGLDAKDLKTVPRFTAGGDQLCYRVPSLKSFDGDDSEDSSDPTQEKCTKINDQVEDSEKEVNIRAIGEDVYNIEPLILSYPYVSGNIDEFTEVSDEVALASIGESEYSSEAAAMSVSEVTEVSDDGILRDDEGNPIDPNEAEENMLRDDEGNIIDPKTLVLRDSFADISCESDEYHDDSGEKNDPQELVSCVAKQGPLVITDNSEGDADIDLRVILLHEESFPHHGCDHRSEDDWSTELSSPLSHCDDENSKNSETKGRRNLYSYRRKRREHSFLPIRDVYAHIMFHNNLSTLVEESQTIGSITSSGDEADSESLWSSRSRARSFKMSRSGSFDEKFIQARWDYSLQVTNSGSFTNNGALIDARDEINDMLRPANSVPDDCSVELETGEI